MEITLPVIAVALLALAAIGLISGFLGIGGGCMIVPVLTWVGLSAGLGAVTIKQAMGTTLLVSSLTAASGFLVHRKRRSGGAPTQVPLAAAVAAGAFLGANTAARWVREADLYPLFGAALLLAAVVFVIRRETGREDELPGGWIGIPLGLPIGFAAGLVGLGGAVFTGLVFSGILGFPIRRVAATTSLAQICGATLGWIGYAWSGQGVEGLAPASLGYVNLPAAAAALVFTLPLARMGARITHRSPPLWARTVFAAVLAFIAVRFLTRG